MCVRKLNKRVLSFQSLEVVWSHLALIKGQGGKSFPQKYREAHGHRYFDLECIGLPYFGD